MRRPIISVFTIAILSYFFLAPISANAQGETKIRGGLKYNTHIEAIGISVGGDMPVADMIRVGGDFNYYLPGDEGGISTTVWTININGYYVVMENGSMTIHALAGINYLNWSYDSDFCDDIFGGFSSFCDLSFTNTGINIGGLAEFGTGNIGFFGTVQLVGITGGSSGLAVGGGVSMAL